MHIAFDIDGVLLNSQTPFLRYANQKYGTAYTFRDIRSFDFSSLFGISSHALAEDFHTFFRSPLYSSLIRPFSGAQQHVRALAQDHTLSAVTARPSEYATLTTTSLRHYFDGCFQHIRHAQGASMEKPVNKATSCKEIGARILIEDSLENACEAMQQGVPAVLIRRPWNAQQRLPPSLRRTTWPNVGRAIRRTFIQLYS